MAMTPFQMSGNVFTRLEGPLGGTGRVAECRVPEDEREDGFPVADGRLPQKKKESSVALRAAMIHVSDPFDPPAIYGSASAPLYGR